MKDSFTYTAHLLPIGKPKFAIKGLKSIEAHEKMSIENVFTKLSNNRKQLIEGTALEENASS